MQRSTTSGCRAGGLGPGRSGPHTPQKGGAEGWPSAGSWEMSSEPEHTLADPVICVAPVPGRACVQPRCAPSVM